MADHDLSRYRIMASYVLAVQATNGLDRSSGSLIVYFKCNVENVSIALEIMKSHVSESSSDLLTMSKHNIILVCITDQAVTERGRLSLWTEGCHRGRQVISVVSRLSQREAGYSHGQ